MAGHDSRHGLVAITDNDLFAIPDELDMGAESRFQIADIYGSHAVIIANMTMLVIS
jgi:hypothetical protein